MTLNDLLADRQSDTEALLQDRVNGPSGYRKRGAPRKARERDKLTQEEKRKTDLIKH